MAVARRYRCVGHTAGQAYLEQAPHIRSKQGQDDHQRYHKERLLKLDAPAYRKPCGLDANSQTGECEERHNDTRSGRQKAQTHRAGIAATMADDG